MYVHDVIPSRPCSFPLTARVVTSIKGAPAEYGVESAQLKPFEKLLQSLEGKLMEGQIFKVHVHVHVHVHTCIQLYM